MGAFDEPAHLAALREKLTHELDGLLPRRDPASPAVVLGAGHDDFEAGRRYLAKLAAGGYAVPTWPVEHGGMGLSTEEAEVVREVLEEHEAPDMYPFMVGLDLVGPTILAHGSEEQKRRWLPALRSGEEIWCQMFSEPDAGSDLANLKTRAVRDGDKWRVSGSKVWTSRAHYSQWGLLLARSNWDVPKHKGITAFGLDMRQPGITIRPLVQMNGDSHFNEVFLDEVSVRDEDRIGAEGEGWRVAITCLSHERGSLAGGLGVSVDQVRALASRGTGPLARGRLVRAAAALEIGRWSAARARQDRQAGRPPGPEGSAAKLWTNRTLKELASAALEIEGCAAVAGGPDRDEWQSLFLVSPSLSIRGGTDEIQRNILGERVLGLPAEPRVDKDRPFRELPGA